MKIMVYMLPVGERTVTVLGICNSGKYNHFLLHNLWRRLCPLNSKGFAGAMYIVENGNHERISYISVRMLLLD